jgi:hypothetical protein
MINSEWFLLNVLVSATRLRPVGSKAPKQRLRLPQPFTLLVSGKTGLKIQE